MKFTQVYIEVTTICGLECTFCPPQSRPKRVMERPLFERIIAQVAPTTRRVLLHVMGDPMVLSDLEWYVACAHRAGLGVIITTSGFYLGPSQRAILTHPAIEQINISLNSFHKNAPTLSFEDYMGNIVALCREKLARDGEHFINLRLWNGDAEEAFNTRVIAWMCDAFHLAHLPSSGRVAKKIRFHHEAYFHWPSMDDPIHSTQGYCPAMRHHIAILVDGSVVPCCLDSEGVMRLGSLLETNLDTILSTHRARALYEGFASHRVVEPLCQRCRYKERFEA